MLECANHQGHNNGVNMGNNSSTAVNPKTRAINQLSTEVIVNSNEALKAMLDQHLKHKLNPAGQLFAYRKLNAQTESGKNHDADVVYSISRVDNSRIKLWIRKPLYCAKFPAIDYTLGSAAREVFFGGIAVKLFGKTWAAKTKFNLNGKGAISRIVGDNEQLVLDLDNYLRRDKIKFSQEAQTWLVRTIIFALIIGDRDIRTTNFIIGFADAQTDSPAKFFYKIDHEYTFCLDEEKRQSLHNLMSEILKKPEILIHLLFCNNYHWNATNGVEFSNVNNALRYYINTMGPNITCELVLTELKDMYLRISENNFKLCNQVINDIKTRFETRKNIYTKQELTEIIYPKIEIAYNNLQNNLSSLKPLIN